MNRVICAWLLWPMSCIADQEAITNYDTTRGQYFYALYAEAQPSDSTDIYCGLRFQVVRRTNGFYGGPSWINIEHAYPAQWMAQSLGCANRVACRADPDVGTRFNHAEADLHNMWPSSSSLNSSRGQRRYGEIEGEVPRELTIGERTFSCDFEREGNVVEPREIVRGNLARSIFYMCHEYGFAVPTGMMHLLKRWSRADPPTEAEIARAERIAEAQGTRNRFIDDPDEANGLQCNVMD